MAHNPAIDDHPELFYLLQKFAGGVGEPAALRLAGWLEDHGDAGRAAELRRLTHDLAEELARVRLEGTRNRSSVDQVYSRFFSTVWTLFPLQEDRCQHGLGPQALDIYRVEGRLAAGEEERQQLLALLARAWRGRVSAALVLADWLQERGDTRAVLLRQRAATYKGVVTRLRRHRGSGAALREAKGWFQNDLNNLFGGGKDLWVELALLNTRPL